MESTFSILQENIDGIETDYIKILTYDLPKGLEEKYSSYAYNRLCTIIEGEKNVKITNEEFTYDNSEFILLDPYSTVNIQIKEATKAIVYELNDKLIDTVRNKLQQIENEETFNNTFYNKIKVSDSMLASINNICSIANTKNSDKEFLIDLYAQELVFKLFKEKHINVKNLKLYNPVHTAIELMKKDGNEKLTINELASKLHMSSSNLAYLFRKELNISPKQYQNILRLKKSKKLLYEYNVTEVAILLGFDNISYFIRLFKSYYGITPKQYLLAN